MKSFGLVLFLVLSVSHATNAQRGCSADDQVPVEEPVRLADFVALLSIDIPESCQEFTNPLQLVPCREELNVASGCCVTQCREVMALFDVQCLEDLTEVLCSSDTTSAAVPLLNGIAARCDDEYTTELTCGEPDTDSDSDDEEEEEEEEPEADSDDEDNGDDEGDDEDEVEEEELDISDAMFADESAVAPEMEDMDKGLEEVEEEEDKRQRRVFGGSRGKDDDDEDDDDDDDDDDDETRSSTTVTTSTSVRGTGTGSASASSSASVTTPGGTRTRTSRSSSRSGSG